MNKLHIKHISCRLIDILYVFPIVKKNYLSFKQNCSQKEKNKYFETLK